jgi:uncharacterized damage-inducible protein DinB
MMRDPNLNGMIEGNLEQLDLLTALLSSLDPALYTRPLPLLNGAWIGKHIRHILDFYLCLHLVQRDGEISYDDRARNEGLEQDPLEALRTIGLIREFLENLTDDHPLVLRTWQQDRKLRIESSLSRELLYACEHGIHHLALLRVTLNGSGIHPPLPEAFGVAPSTLRYLAGKQPY